MGTTIQPSNTGDSSILHLAPAVLVKSPTPASADPRSVGRAAPPEATISAQDGTVGTDILVLAGELEAVRAELEQERSARRRAERALEAIQRRDSLTGLPDRSALMARLERAIARRADHERVASLVVDVDRFAAINDALGPEAGDAALQIIARRLKGTLRGEAVYRAGGDEFVVVLEGIVDAAQAMAVARRIQRSLAVPVDLGSRPVALTATIGLSIHPEDAADPPSLLQGADIAMRRAKRAGVQLRRLGKMDTGGHLNDLLELENDLRGALSRGEMTVAYQPRLSVERDAIVGAEALLRWSHPLRGDISPDVFIPIAERIRIIDQIGGWALQQACAEAQRWLSEGLGPLRIAVNLSPGQVNLQLLAEVEDALQCTGLDPDRLELELTESLLVDGGAAPALLLETLATRGIRISLDDFGTGYSNLGYLQRLHVSALKIDRSFVSGLGVDPDATSIIRAIIALARSLRMRVIAEGIERPDQLALLQEHGCDDYQGFLASPALEPQAFVELVRRRAATG